eukprot:10186344-Alexandrium_andersonii.AAC.1
MDGGLARLQARGPLLHLLPWKAGRPQDQGHGERPGFGAGVYAHNNSKQHLAGSYNIRYVPLCRDGVLCGVKWELVVDRADRCIPDNKTDQWIQTERSVRFVALWFRGATADQLQDGAEAN